MKTVQVFVGDPSDLGQVAFTDRVAYLLPANLSTKLLGVVNVPSVLDLMGINNGGGPAGIVVENVTGVALNRFRVFLPVSPGGSLPAGVHVGTVVTSAMVVSLFEYGTREGEVLALDVIQDYMADFRLLQLKEYTTPAEIENAINERARLTRGV